MNNAVTIAGNLGRDIEVKHSAAGNAVASFSVAVSRKRGEETETTWVRCVAFGELAENLAGVAHKGTRVIVSGRLQESRWTDKEGSERVTLELVADEAGPSMRWAQRGSGGLPSGMSQDAVNDEPF
jgi:single-strand DNA-binding protein